MGYEQMGDRGPFRFLVAAVSGQSYQREQGHWERATAHQQQDDHCFKDGGQRLAAKRYLSGSAVPSIQNQVRGSGCDQGHGGQTGPLGLPHAPLRDAVRRQRSGDLPGAAPAVTDQAAQVESRHPGIPTHRSSSGLRSTSFWGAAKQPRLGLLPADGNFTTANAAARVLIVRRLATRAVSYNRNDASRQLWPSFPWCFYARC